MAEPSRARSLPALARPEEIVIEDDVGCSSAPASPSMKELSVRLQKLIPLIDSRTPNHSKTVESIRRFNLLTALRENHKAGASHQLRATVHNSMMDCGLRERGEVQRMDEAMVSVRKYSLMCENVVHRMDGGRFDPNDVRVLRKSVHVIGKLGLGPAVWKAPPGSNVPLLPRVPELVNFLTPLGELADAFIGARRERENLVMQQNKMACEYKLQRIKEAKQKAASERAAKANKKQTLVTRKLAKLHATAEEHAAVKSEAVAGLTENAKVIEGAARERLLAEGNLALDAALKKDEDLDRANRALKLATAEAKARVATAQKHASEAKLRGEDLRRAADDAAEALRKATQSAKEATMAADIQLTEVDDSFSRVSRAEKSCCACWLRLLETCQFSPMLEEKTARWLGELADAGGELRSLLEAEELRLVFRGIPWPEAEEVIASVKGQLESLGAAKLKLRASRDPRDNAPASGVPPASVVVAICGRPAPLDAARDIALQSPERLGYAAVVPELETAELKQERIAWVLERAGLGA